MAGVLNAHARVPGAGGETDGEMGVAGGVLGEADGAEPSRNEVFPR
jgi:hypothetical protein